MHKRFNKSQKQRALTSGLLLAGILLGTTSCNNASEAQQDSNETQQTMETSRVYVGTYAEPDTESIYLYNLNSETGELTREAAYKAGENPSYLALSPDRQHLYVVNETISYEGEESGAVSAFAINGQGASLSLLNKVASKGGAPCYIALNGNTVLVANYVGGNVAAYAVQADGKLSTATTVQQHEGTGPNEKRQEAPHAHYFAPGPTGKYNFAVDLGADKVLAYTLEDGKLTSPTVAFTAAPGSGPRHLAFRPDGKYAYLLHELNSTLVALAYNAENDTFEEVQALSTLPEGFTENNQPAAVKVSPDGKYVYSSNRGHNSMAVFAIDAETGKIRLVETVPTGGDWPRDFSIDPSGNILLVANERSNNITTFKIDKTTGKLTATGHEAQVPKPVNLVFE